MKQKHLLLSILCAGILQPAANAAVRYVRSVATGAGDGSSWINASGDLQLMIDQSSANDEVWVAGGVYRPARLHLNTNVQSPGNRMNSFVVKPNVKIYGGFAGGENELSQRNWHTNLTELNGDIGIPGDRSDNCFSVVRSLSAAGTATLDGFTILNGNANGASVNLYSGGGMYLQQSNLAIANLYSGPSVLLMIRNSVFQGNYASGAGNTGGGAVYNYSDVYADFVNCTFAGNRAASYGGAVYTHSNGGDNLKNCIVWGNEAGIRGNNILDSLGASPVVWYSIVEGGFPGAGNSAGNPFFTAPVSASLAPTGSGNYQLQKCSPATNSGNNTYLAAADSLDHNGAVRVQNTTVDRGAYETTTITIAPDANGVVFVKNSNSSEGNGGSWSNAAKDLSDALKAAYSNSAIRQIWVASGTYYPLYTSDSMLCSDSDNRKKSFVVPNGVKIYGGFAGTESSLAARDWHTNTTTLSGDIGMPDDNTDNSLHVVIAAGISDTATLIDGFTITRGNAASSAIGTIYVRGVGIDPGMGGGMQNCNFKGCAIRNCIFTGNYATTGGGLANIACSPKIANSTFSSNNAGYAGGICNYAAASPVISHCIISGNQASYGAGISNMYSAAPHILNCVISGNYALANISGGGGIFNFNGSHPLIGSCTITGNKSNNRGGGMFSDVSSEPTVRNSIVWLNDAGNGADNIDTANASITAVAYSIIEGGYPGLEVQNEHPWFHTSISPANAPTTAGNFRLALCSPAINTGDTFLLPNDILTDMEGNDRILQDHVDLGAYEANGFTLPVQPGDSISSHIYCETQGASALPYDNWNHFYQYPQDRLLLSINDPAITLQAPYIAVSKLRNEYSTGATTSMNNPFGQSGYFYPMNRSWSFSAGGSVTVPVSVRFYINEQDSIDISAQHPFGSLRNLVLYKVNGNDPYDVAAGGYQQYTYAATADTNHFTFGRYQDKRYVEFKVNSFSSGTLALRSSTPLAIVLGAFSGQSIGQRNRLNWNTYKEAPGDYFEIERSSDGRNFAMIAQQAAAGNQEARYEYWDDTPIAGDNYYRLKMKGTDGQIQYSKVLQLRNETSGTISLSLFPNPVKETLRISISGDRSGKGSFTVTDLSGRTFLQQEVHAADLQLNMSALPPGVYLIKYTDGQHAVMQKCVKQ